MDGNPIIYRACSIKKEGEENEDLRENGSGLYGLFMTLTKALEDFQPNELYVVWDCIPQQNWRRKIYPDYKSNRAPKTPEEMHFRQLIREQVKAAQDILRFLPIKQFMFGCFEGDDLAYWITRRMFLSKKDVQPQFILVTVDRDWLQLVRWDVIIYLSDIDYTVTLKNFSDHTVRVMYELKNTRGVRLGDFISYKSIVGDKSDGIEGVKGIGPKTMVDLLDNSGGEKLEDLDARIWQDSNLIKRNELLIDLSKFPYTPEIDQSLQTTQPPKAQWTVLKDLFRKQRQIGLLANLQRMKIAFSVLETG